MHNDLQLQSEFVEWDWEWNLCLESSFNISHLSFLLSRCLFLSEALSSLKEDIKFFFLISCFMLLVAAIESDSV